jgi:membrane protease YdiL (CAAX protease family)
MLTTSSPTSSGRSNGHSTTGLSAWLAIAAILIVLGFAGQAASGGMEGGSDLFYDYGLALSSLVIYGILVGLTIWTASAYGDPFQALGLTVFSVKWAGIAVGLILLVLGLSFVLEPILHAGEEQGYAPDVWRPEHARAFFVNGVVAATFVPFAEELFFRGLGVRVLAFLGSTAAMVGTALVFGLAHGILVALPVLVAFGFALAWVRLRSDSVWPGVVAHGLFNALAVVAVYAELTK